MGEKWSGILSKVATSTLLLGYFTCRELRHGTDGFTSPPKEDALRFEPVNLGTRGKHAYL